MRALSVSAMSKMSVKDCLKAAASLDELSESPRLDIELLLCAVLDWPRTRLFIYPEHLLNTDQQRRFERLVKQRREGRPIAHLLGEREFWSLPLSVNDSTLIPRPDTETLVEVSLSLALPKDARALDLGTGTGAIALALASENSQWRLDAVDVQPQAVELARQNCRQLSFDNVNVVQGSWFEPVEGLYHLIVSNPPYIDSEDPHLNQGDVRFEPISALVADESGLADLRLIIESATEYLLPDGWLVLEHGWQQSAAVQALMQASGYREVRTEKDLGGNDRVTLGRLPNY